MQRVKRLLSMAVLLVAPQGVQASEPETIDDLLGHYEAIRLALFEDELTDVRQNASAIAEEARALVEAFDAARAGVAEADGEKGREVLDEIASAASRVAEAAGLEAIREAFFDLSKPMGRYRKLTGDTSTIVVFCPMVKKAWLQPEGEIGNPYAGQSMPRCGDHIPD